MEKAAAAAYIYLQCHVFACRSNESNIQLRSKAGERNKIITKTEQKKTQQTNTKATAKCTRNSAHI